MQVLDVDLDYFLDAPVNDPANDGRVSSLECVESVWEKERVVTFLETHLGLSKDKKIRGRILTDHDEALYFWNELIEAGYLNPPFSVVHVDSHADLGFGRTSASFICNDLILRDLELRKLRFCSNCEYDGCFYNIDVGNYLLYAIANRWISKLVYCSNQDAGDIPPQILSNHIDTISKPVRRYIHLKPDDPDEVSAEPVVPLYVLPPANGVKFSGKFDFISIAQSPDYTPEKADYILDIFREYIEEI